MDCTFIQVSDGVFVLVDCCITHKCCISGVPNTTQSTQETHICYGPFKSAYRINLATITQARRDGNLPVSFPPHYCVLFTFGGKDPVSGAIAPRNAFEEGFSKEQCLKAWAKVGAAPATRACLKDPKVARQLGDSEDDFQLKMRLIQDLNDRSVAALEEKGWAGHFLKASLKPMKEVAPIFKPHSKEPLETLANASKAGARFHATGGDIAASDDVFRAEVVNQRKERKAELLKIKKDSQEKEKLQLECHGILRHVGPGPPKKPNADQLKLLLKWQGLEVKRYKPENEATWESFFSDFDNWEALPNRVAERWTAQDERELEALDDYSTITMNDTALQLKIDESKRDLRMAAAKMDEEERAEILAIFARGDRAESSSAAAAASANNNEAAEDDSAPCSC
jgi:hypothetical protein